MKGLYVVNNPAFGGGQGQFARLAAPLAERGWRFSVAVPPGEAETRLTAAGLEVDTVRLHRLRDTRNPIEQAGFLGSIPSEVAALRRLIRRREIDLVQVHGDTNPHAAIAGHLEGVAVVWQLYDTRTPHALRRVTMPLVARLADVVTTWGERLGHEYPGTSRFGHRWIPVYPPVDGEEFKPGPDRRARGRDQLNVDDRQVAVALVAMINRQKGHDAFVRALAMVRERQPEVVGRILGASNPGHREYEQRLRDEAQRLGLSEKGVLEIRDAGGQVPLLIPGVDILALASVPRSEGMPTVILEAMACAIPVVATDVGAVRELVLDGETGRIVKPHDERALANAIAELAGDADLRRQFGEAGRRRFEATFRLERLADRHAQAYELALEHRRRRTARSARPRGPFARP